MLVEESENRSMEQICPYSCNNEEKIMKISNNNQENNAETKSCMLKEIKDLQFAIIELALYLDTHPDDKKALCLHKKYCKELEDLKDKYQKAFGPLTINFPCNKWKWIDEPWPWENERGNN